MIKMTKLSIILLLYNQWMTVKYQFQPMYTVKIMSILLV